MDSSGPAGGLAFRADFAFIGLSKIRETSTFDGVVESISSGSGASFSVLPPENASGNWVKVTQRFPVRIALTNPPADKPLRVGASTSVTIDTTQAKIGRSMKNLANMRVGASGAVGVAGG